MKTVIVVDGINHVFLTEGGATKLKLEAETTEATDVAGAQLKLPDIWLITRKNGTPIFGLRPESGDKAFRILTAEKLYEEKIQWFEPLARYYRRLIWVNPESTRKGADVYLAYKHVTWGELIEFAIVDRLSISFHSLLPGDWKKSDKGGDGYLLVLMQDQPYWTDGIGQIPYAVNTFRKYWRETRNKDLAIRKTGETGIRWGSGKFYEPAETGPGDVYDNFMILRGALWASENFRLEVKQHTILDRGIPYEIETADAVYAPTSKTRLTRPISQSDIDRYGVWQR
ncbi:hypothetical protein ACXM5X_17125 [Pseudomonas saponiphila]|uniref:Uncharacterized protein n=1 Tax=Pseudomonas saponiphila TaxID=556534 RepID=A0A1H4QJ53_9PSED|nr:hypothetical protein [Pseudomonas saponiphila]SEC19574.1 hypothetical protein SAMN05216178_3792 [Pseudomonas saponiphila]